jgi:heme/copper-type cytochrome/quinol oxidase subunit 2
VVIVFAIAVLASTVAHAAILTSVVRRASTVADASVPRPKPIVEIAWALIPVLALALVLTATWARVRDRATPPPGAVMKIAR